VDLDGASPEKELKPVTREPKPAAARAVAAPETPDPVAVDTLTEELQLVRGARAQLVRGDAPAAFELLHRHTLRFPTGVLREERLALQVMTACKLGRAPDAREAMATLQRIAPRSPHLSRSSAACVNPNP
jgi:hypothetical protein